MTRPDDRADDDAPTVYARLAAQTEVFTRTRPVAPVTRWVGRAIVAAILVAVVIGVTVGSPW
jgi:hypothetical protein